MNTWKIQTYKHLIPNGKFSFHNVREVWCLKQAELSKKVASYYNDAEELKSFLLCIICEDVCLDESTLNSKKVTWDDVSCTLAAQMKH